MRTALPLVLLVGVLVPVASGDPQPARAPAPRSLAELLTPYSSDADHPWNRLHQSLFVRRVPGAGRRIHTTDPLLFRGGTFLHEGDSHRDALAELDRFLAAPEDDTTRDPLKRLFLQRDLWAAFDYCTWYPDDWVFKSKYEPAAIALRSRLAKAIGRLAQDERVLAGLPDNYAAAVKSKQFAADHDPKHPERPFLPPDLFDENGPWVRFHELSAEPMAREHYDGAGGRAAHAIFLRLPGGRGATERYLKELRAGPMLEQSHRPTLPQFPQGTMVAMVRRAFAVDSAVKVRVTPITELVQIRVYRRIPANPNAPREGDFGEQDAYEFVLDRSELIAGKHGLRAVGRDDPADVLFQRREGDEPFERNGRTAHRPPAEPEMPQLKTCIECHQAPGVYSVLSMDRGVRRPYAQQFEVFRTYAWDVEMSYTVKAKVKQFDWGLLQGKLEAR